MARGRPRLGLERGVVSRAWSYLNFAPTLVVARDEIDRMVTIADEALTIAERELAGEFEAQSRHPGSASGGRAG